MIMHLQCHFSQALTAAHEVNEAAPRCRQHTPPPIGPYETIITGLEPMHASTTAPTNHHRSTVLDSSYSSAHAIDNSNHPLEPDRPTLSPSKCHQVSSPQKHPSATHHVDILPVAF
jgi:hypothetical protein